MMDNKVMEFVLKARRALISFSKRLMIEPLRGSDLFYTISPR